MSKILINIGCRLVIDASHQGGFEEDVFNDTYSELLMQAQIYNKEKKFTNFWEIVSANPKANSLHYKVGFAIGLYVKALSNRIPGHDLSFENYHFQILDSDLVTKSKHKVAINFISKPFILVDSFGDRLLLANAGPSQEVQKRFPDTFMVQLNENIFVSGYEKLGL